LEIEVTLAEALAAQTNPRILLPKKYKSKIKSNDTEFISIILVNVRQK
jgi:hypothetical protein